MNETSTIDVRVVPGPQHVGELSREKSVERLKKRVHELGDSIGEIAGDLRERLDVTLADRDDSSWALDQVQLSFSLDLEAEAGVVVARAKTNAGFEVMLNWSRRGTAAAG